ncbi:MAG TPA: GNAT family N-acetyltransferase [Polyangiaceae bacterium]|nr:GNAT family N-acetyltransferase [Polyangiaceae bacterium]
MVSKGGHAAGVVSFDGVLPRQRPELRSAKARDTQKLVELINQGRREGSFAGDTVLTPASFRSYRRELSARGLKHEVLLASVGGEDVGYVDYAARGQRGEILGLYVEPSARRLGLGSYLTAIALNALTAWGTTSASAEAFGNNRASLATATALGLRKAGKRAGKAQRPVLRLGLPLEPFARVKPRLKGYEFLQGESWLAHHLAMARVLSAKLSRLPGVQAVLGLGSVARGFADAWSDLDLAVILRGAQGVPWRGERWFAGVSVDLYAVDLEASPIAGWDESRRQAFEEGIVLYSRPGFSLPGFRKALRLDESTRRNAMVELLFKIGWLGFEPRAWYGRVVHGYRWALPHDLWLERGSIPAAHVMVDRVLDYLFELLFLVNGRRPVDPKWRRYLVEHLAWLPQRFSRGLAALEGARRDRGGFAMRARVLHELVEATVKELIRRGDLPKAPYESILRNVGEYQLDR